MTAREELAAVLLEQLNAEYGDEGWTELGSLRRIADALFASPALARVIREREAEVLREAAHVYGVIWGSGETTEAQVGEVLTHWAAHGVGARMDCTGQTEEPT